MLKHRHREWLVGPLLAAFALLGNDAGAGQTGFGENGLVTISIPDFADVNGVDIVIDNLGRIVVSGAVGDFFALFNTQEIAVARLLPDGSLDTAFDDDGSAVTAFGGSSIHHIGRAGARRSQQDRSLGLDRQRQSWGSGSSAWRASRRTGPRT